MNLKPQKVFECLVEAIHCMVKEKIVKEKNSTILEGRVDLPKRGSIRRKREESSSEGNRTFPSLLYPILSLVHYWTKSSS